MQAGSRLREGGDEFVAGLVSAADFDGCMDVLAEHLRTTGFERAAYCCMPSVRRPDGACLPPRLTVRNFPPRWDVGWDRYSVHDPYFHACLRRTIPIDWTMVQRQPCLTAIQRECINYLAHFGLVKGLTVPIHLPHGGLAFISAIAHPGCENWPEVVELSRHQLLVRAHQFQSIAPGKLAASSGLHAGARLTSRETECLSSTARGRSYGETARLLGRSIDTVRLHLRSACSKLGAVNRAHAVAKAISLGLIETDVRPGAVAPRGVAERTSRASSPGGLRPRAIEPRKAPEAIPRPPAPAAAGCN
jgi:LuxR family transcriptional regulator